MQKNELKIILFASGNGTIVQNLLAYEKSNLNTSQKKPISIVSVVTDNPNANVINICKEEDKTIACFPFLENDNKETYSQKLLTYLDTFDDISFLCLAGFMRILSSRFIQSHFDSCLGVSRIINIHPSLLPSFKGRQGYRDSFLHGVSVSGATLHFVDEKIDDGLIIGQSSFYRNPLDSFEDYKMKGMRLEYELYRYGLSILQNDAYKIVRKDDQLYFQIEQEYFREITSN